MVRPPKTSTLVLVGLVLILSAVASAGQWITPDWPAGKEPQFKPVPLFWFEVKECPVVYRTEIEVPKEADRATALLRTSGYVYVYVDGRLAFSWAPQGEDKKAGRPAVPADKARVHEVDLSEFLTPGRHVVAVSAPKDGFVLDGGLYAGTKRLAPLVSDGKWTVSKFAPTTILEDEPALKLGFKGEVVPVKATDEWKAEEDDLAKAYSSAFLRTSRRELDELKWRVDLLGKKNVDIGMSRRVFINQSLKSNRFTLGFRSL